MPESSAFRHVDDKQVITLCQQRLQDFLCSAYRCFCFGFDTWSLGSEGVKAIHVHFALGKMPRALTGQLRCHLSLPANHVPGLRSRSRPNETGLYVSEPRPGRRPFCSSNGIAVKLLFKSLNLFFRGDRWYGPDFVVDRETRHPGRIYPGEACLCAGPGNVLHQYLSDHVRAVL